MNSTFYWGKGVDHEGLISNYKLTNTLTIKFTQNKLI